MFKNPVFWCSLYLFDRDNLLAICNPTYTGALVAISIVSIIPLAFLIAWYKKRKIK